MTAREGETVRALSASSDRPSNAAASGHPETHAAAKTSTDAGSVRGAKRKEGRLAQLRFDDRGAFLTDGQMELRGDFARLLPRIRSSRIHGELLVKAAKLKGAGGDGTGAPTAIDATAGLGEDAFLLAAAGFAVHMYERNPVIATLLRDALERAAHDPELAPIAARMQVHEQDSLTELRRLAAVDRAGGESPATAASRREEPQQPSETPEIILLDPMFPARTKSAAVKKKFQLLHGIERPCTEAEGAALLHAALAAHPRKVIVKRPPKGPYLAGVKPNYSLSGKAVRFDCYVP